MASRVVTDHDEIQEWAEERGAKPACVSRTGQGDIGMIRLEFPGAPNANDSNLEEISWDDFFGKFDDSRLALLVEDERAAGGSSNFNKLIGRETAEAAQRGEKTSRHASRSGGRKPAAKTAARGGSRSKTGAKSAAKKSAKKTASKKSSAGSTRKAGKKTASKFATLRVSKAASKRAASGGKPKKVGRSAPPSSGRSSAAKKPSAASKRTARKGGR